MLVADIMYPSKEVVASGSGIVLRLDDGAASALLTLKYGHHVANEVGDTKVRERYEDGPGNPAGQLRPGIACAVRRRATTRS